ncbi:MAG: hypothetical protein AAB335_02400, partial [candidate division NC10 bacterium]
MLTPPADTLLSIRPGIGPFPSRHSAPSWIATRVPAPAVSAAARTARAVTRVLDDEPRRCDRESGLYIARLTGGALSRYCRLGIVAPGIAAHLHSRSREMADSCLEWFREKDIAAISWDM